MPPDTATRLIVNGRHVVVDADPDSPLIMALRNDLGLKGTRPGCSIGECGACTVIVDGQPVRSCNTPLGSVAGSRVTTPEGLGVPDTPHPVQQAFLDEQAAQCGYCINGMIMTVAALLDGDEPASEDAIREALWEHLCRCGTHVRVLRAVTRAATGAPPPAPHDRGSERPAPAAQSLGGDADHASVTPPPALARHPAVEAWLGLLPDGRVEARSGKVEFGQGLRTTFAQIVAAQLGVPVEQVVVRSAATDATPDEGYTAGSLSVEEGGTALAIAAVAFRRLLLARAAVGLEEPVEGLRLDGDGVSSTATGRRVALADLAAAGPVTGTIEPGDRPHWHGGPFGTPLPREDLRPKLTGAPAYVHDLDLPGMLHARALLPPSYDARLQDVDADAARGLSGVRAVVHDGRLLLAVAEREEQAVRAASRLGQSATWDDPGLDFEADLVTTLRSLPPEPMTARDDGGVDAALESSPRRLQATYVKPYQAHGAMAPSCAVALADGDTITVWTHSQGVYPLRRELAALLGEDEARLVIRHGDGPGCYGHNGADDAAAFAALAARSVPGSPVRFQFSVEDEFAWEPYGSAMLADLEAALDEAGRVVAWRHRSRTDVHTTRPAGTGDRLVPAWLAEPQRPRPWTGPHDTGSRDSVPLYDLPAVHAATDFVRGPLRTSALRSLASFLNVFAVESFMDELADAAGQDPVAFRLAHLGDERARHVLQVAAEAAGWSAHVGPSGRGQGVAVCRYKGNKAYVAQVVDADIDQESAEITVRRVVLACDAGAVVNPDGLRNQLEGGTIQGLSRALYEEVRADRRGIASRDWTSYPVLRFGHVPQVEVLLVDRPGHPPLGAGEASTPPVAAALANAVDDAIGVRLRHLPLTPERIRQRLLDLTDAEAARVRLE